ncbi:MAG: DUF488 domain-containing protein [Bacteroidetes bacterium]|nr:MAG: DUF488 domain-containing protein [Bacteroidota bacterium]
MYYRRKILLSLLQASGNKLDKISLQKLLFLFSRQQEVKSYHFVPYKFGCFSFQANADLHTMTKYKQVVPSLKYWKKTDEINYLDELKPKDKRAIQFIVKEYGSLTKDELITLTYRQYPFYAINSQIANSILTTDEIKKIEKQRPDKSTETLFTIGYEGLSLEQYLNKLIINGVTLLCDVRKNPLSMKYGFSKNQLKNACEGVGITYIHIPEVGIESDKRQQLNTQSDYDQLFTNYKSQTLKNADIHKKEILNLLKTKKRIALTCFEANIHQCHRKHLAESIAKMQEYTCELKHI